MLNRRENVDFAVGWKSGLPETACGYGSTIEATHFQREWIAKIVQKYKIKSIADIGAGDLNWVQHIGWRTIVEYTPYDIYPRSDHIFYMDIRQHTPPKVNMLWCIWVLNHLTYDECRSAIYNILSSQSQYLIVTYTPRLHFRQPPEVVMSAIESLTLNEHGDSLILAEIN